MTTNPSTPIPTPRVDALDFEDQMKFPGPGYGELWELARNLERELQQARAERDREKEIRSALEGAMRASVDAAHNVAIEEACAICEEIGYSGVHSEPERVTANRCASVIRKLKREPK